MRPPVQVCVVGGISPGLFVRDISECLVGGKWTLDAAGMPGAGSGAVMSVPREGTSPKLAT